MCAAEAEKDTPIQCCRRTPLTQMFPSLSTAGRRALLCVKKGEEESVGAAVPRAERLVREGEGHRQSALLDAESRDADDDSAVELTERGAHNGIAERSTAENVPVEPRMIERNWSVCWMVCARSENPPPSTEASVLTVCTICWNGEDDG